VRELLVIVQARMSSSRFPGKVLAPFRGEPVIRHVLRAAESLLPLHEVVVATSTDASDDPLAAYTMSLGAPVVRGPLENVFERFRQAVRQYPSEWVMRVNADSPMLHPLTLQRVFAARLEGSYDLVTTVFPRTFPAGQNAELIRVSTLLAVDDGALTSADKEHVTTFFYHHADRLKIRNVESDNRFPLDDGFAVDTIEDLRRMERYRVQPQ
jgi:spore coat polysaccharide biosynthesis protein SpsF